MPKNVSPGVLLQRTQGLQDHEVVLAENGKPASLGVRGLTAGEWRTLAEMFPTAKNISDAVRQLIALTRQATTPGGGGETSGNGRVLRFSDDAAMASWADAVARTTARNLGGGDAVKEAVKSTLHCALLQATPSAGPATPPPKKS